MTLLPSAAISAIGNPSRCDPGNLLEERVVAAGRLGAALDDVTGDDRAGERVEIVRRPVEAPGGRTHHESGIRHPPGDDDVCARGRARP